LTGKFMALEPNALKLKYLWVYSAGDEWTVNWHNRLIKRRRTLGYEIEGFCNTPLSLERRWLHFSELDERWRKKDRVLMEMYDDLAKQAEDKDVLILYNGANLHPEFVRSLKVLKVYTAGDDPESTEVLTKPIAPAFDIHLINNIDCLGMYRSWGLKDVHFWPLGSKITPEELSDLNEKNIRDISRRDNPLVFLGGYQQHRKKRFDKIAKVFPQAYFAGSGWPEGFIAWDKMWNIYRRTQIGWNFHNSTGPINFRTYELPACGVMQICDNKSNLGRIFKLNKEVVGFDTISQCIKLTKYYLEHKEEQRKIAVNGWKRWKREYHPDKVWEKAVKIIEEYWSEHNSSQKDLAEKKHWENLYGRIKNENVTRNWKPDNYCTLTLDHILSKEIRQYKPKHILEVGCGNSVWLPYLGNKLKLQCSGVDYSKEGCRLAEERLKLEKIKGDVHCVDIFNKKIEDIGQFDFVFSLGVVEHFSDLNNVLRRLDRLVKPGGALLTEVPNITRKSIHGILSWIWQPKLLAKHNPVSKSGLEKAYTRMGYQDIHGEYSGIFSLDIVAWEIYPRSQKAANTLVPWIRKTVAATDRYLCKKNKYKGNPITSPFIYVCGVKPK